MFRLVTLALFAAALYGQDDALARAAKDPYDLARYLNSKRDIDWKSVWTALGAGGLPDMPRCEAGTRECSIQAITIFRPTQVILAVSGPWNDGYIRFFEENGGWRFAGSFDNGLSKNYGGRYEVSRLDDTSYLRISAQGSNGGLRDSEIETWFDLSLPDFEPVFQFTPQGSDLRLGLGRWVQATAAAAPDASANVILLDVNVVFSTYHEFDGGFAKYRAIYMRQPNEKRFSLKGVHPWEDGAPVITKEAFEDLVNISGDDIPRPSEEQMLVYTLPRLKEIASGSDAPARQWLKEVVDSCKDTPEKRELQLLLDAKP